MRCAICYITNTACSNPVNRHFMSQVIPCIEAEKAEDEAILMAL